MKLKFVVFSNRIQQLISSDNAKIKILKILDYYYI